MNVVLIFDEDDQVVDIHTYCSDFCAQRDVAYDGWYGCVENEQKTSCLTCGKQIPGLEGEEG